MVLLRVEFGVLSRGKMGPTELVTEYLRFGRANEVRMNAVILTECTELATSVHDTFLSKGLVRKSFGLKTST